MPLESSYVFLHESTTRPLILPLLFPPSFLTPVSVPQSQEDAHCRREVLSAVFLFLLKLSPLVLTPPDKTSAAAGGEEDVGTTGRPIALARLAVASLFSSSSSPAVEESGSGEAIPLPPPFSFWAGNVHRYLSCVLALLQRFSLLANWPGTEDGEAEEEEGPLSLYIR